MNAQENKLALLKQLIDTAEHSLRSASELLAEINGEPAIVTNGNGSKRPTNGLTVSGDGKVIEGVFDGENMIGPDGKKYPVPPNYASKSKLVSGDILKLTISENGSFIYKQIGPVERVQIVGTLKKIGASHIVTAEQGDYNVLTASVTYFKAEPGDQVTLIVAAGSKSGWGAIENIIPKVITVETHTSIARPAASMSAEPETFEIPKTLFQRTD